MYSCCKMASDVRRIFVSRFLIGVPEVDVFFEHSYPSLGVSDWYRGSDYLHNFSLE